MTKSPRKVTRTVTSRANQTYLRQRREIAPYVSPRLLRLSPTKRPTEAQKRRVREYHRALAGYKNEKGLLSLVAQVVRAKDVPARGKGKAAKQRAAIEKLQREVGMPRLKYLNVAFIETSFDKRGKPVKSRIVYRKREPDSIIVHGVDTRTAEFNPRIMASDDDARVRAHIRAAIERLPKGAKVRYYIQAGNYLIQSSLSKKEIPDAIRRYQAKYDKDDSHHWSRWLFGVVAKTAGKQKSIHEAREAILAARRENKKLRRKVKKGNRNA